MIRIGIGYDSHRFAPDRRLILGGVDIPHPRGLLGHSDADALLHAIGDAILGALSAGDIGVHFPDRNPAYKDISSLVLLDKIHRLARQRGYRLGNVDATIVLECPKLRDYIPAMADRIASVLAIPVDCVGIKAKTNEGMGFVGREEGIAVMAVVTVVSIEPM